MGLSSNSDRREFTIYACTEPGCSYYRDNLSTGTHHVDIPDPKHKGRFIDGRHKIAPLVVVPKEQDA